MSIVDDYEAPPELKKDIFWNLTEPELIEKWIPEEKLELWEIRAYRDRLERDRTASQTRTRTGASIREPQRLDPSPATPTVKVNYKAEMDDKFKQQQARSVLSQKQPQQPSQIQAQRA